MTPIKKSNPKEEIKKKLISKRRDIKSKLNALKHSQIAHENMFQPITKHLEVIEKKLNPRLGKKHTGNISKQNTTHMKNEAEEEADEDDSISDVDSIASEPIRSTSTPMNFEDTPKGTLGSITAPRLKRKLSFSTVATVKKPQNMKKLLVQGVKEEMEAAEIEKQKEYENQLNRSIKEKSFTDYAEQYHNLPFKYVKKFIEDPKNYESDGKFRVKFDKDIEAFYIGNKRIDFDGPDLLIAGKKFKGTKGLYGLLFNKTVPKFYSEEDSRNYVHILNRTNALRKNFNPNSDMITSKNTKFKKLVEPLISQGQSDRGSESQKKPIDSHEIRQGQGMLMEVTNNPIDYVFWDDPNELVTRLKLLLASEIAGNTGHINEINSIVEELREANIIE